MTAKGSPPAGWTRRAVLSTALVTGWRAAAGTLPRFPSEKWRYADPSTETPVVRLTRPAYSSGLPAYYARTISRRNALLLFWNDRTGRPQGYSLDLKSGESRQLTEAAAFDGSSLTLTPDERGALYFDGPSLRRVDLRSRRDKEIYRLADGWKRAPGFGVASGGAFFVERNGGLWRLRQAPLGKGAAVTVIEDSVALSHPIPRPGAPALLYRQGDTLAITDPAGQRGPRLAGVSGPAMWSADGRSVFFQRGDAIEEWNPESGEERKAAATSRLAHFGVNGNATVFAAASGSQSAPYLLLLLRSPRRELALCEHRAREAGQVAPRFSPDSQSVYFQSDRDGKSAIYCVQVDRLVERTGD